MRRALLIALLLLSLVILALRPVCVPISAEALQQFTVPIEQRTDRDLYLKVFQARQG